MSTIYVNNSDLSEIDMSQLPLILCETKNELAPDHVRGPPNCSMHANTHSRIKISNTELPLVRKPILLGVYLIPYFHLMLTAYKWPTESVKKQCLEGIAGTNWGQQKKTLLLTYKTLGRSIAN